MKKIIVALLLLVAFVHAKSTRLMCAPYELDSLTKDYVVKLTKEKMEKALFVVRYDADQPSLTSPNSGKFVYVLTTKGFDVFKSVLDPKIKVFIKHDKDKIYDLRLVNENKNFLTKAVCAIK